MAERFCVICGKKFDGHFNAKYCCDICRKKGENEKLTTWRRKTGYSDKQKKAMRQKRERKQKPSREFANNNQREKAKNQKSKEQQDLFYKQNKPACNMNNIMRENQGFRYSVKYWENYQEYILNFNKEFNRKNSDQVNGISILDPEFPEKVIEKIKKDNVVMCIR